MTLAESPVWRAASQSNPGEYSHKLQEEAAPDPNYRSEWRATILRRGVGVHGRIGPSNLMALGGVCSGVASTPTKQLRHRILSRQQG